MMRADEKPDVSYADIGGLDIQKQEVREAVELPLTQMELYRQTIATRVFRPSEYLGRNVATSARLRPETPFQVELDVLAPDIPEDLTMLKRVQADHKKIYEAIAEGDSNRARTAMRNHLNGSKELYTAYHEKQQANS